MSERATSVYGRNADGLPKPERKTTYQLLVEVIAWAGEAAQEAVSLDRFCGEPTSEDFGMGLWQSFQARFPKRDGIDYDILVSALSATYRATVRACLKQRDAEAKGNR